MTSLFLTRNIDFRVYWYGANRLFQPSKPLYGPASGSGFPMHYRYAPVTYFLFWPLTRIPLYWAGALWMLGAWGAAAGAAGLAIRTQRLRFTRRALALLCAFLLPYAVLAIRSGNVQIYIVAMILTALMLSESRPAAAALLMALAITFKIWPVLFLPCFLRRGRRFVLVWLIPGMLLLWLPPLLVWSPAQYLDLTRQWVRSEFQTATAASEVWCFPGQSLRGVLLRYLTSASPWIAGFPDIHALELSPALVIYGWEAITAASYLTACFFMLRCDPGRRHVWDGVPFALIAILQPFCLKSGMILMAPAALTAAALYSDRKRAVRNRPACWLFSAACALSFFGAIAQHKPLLRLLLALGLDFYAALLVWTFRSDPAR